VYVDDGGCYGEYFDLFGHRPILLHLNATWMNTDLNGLTSVNSCRVQLMDFVDIIVYAFVYLEVEV